MNCIGVIQDAFLLLIYVFQHAYITIWLKYWSSVLAQSWIEWFWPTKIVVKRIFSIFQKLFHTNSFSHIHVYSICHVVKCLWITYITRFVLGNVMTWCSICLYDITSACLSYINIPYFWCFMNSSQYFSHWQWICIGIQKCLVHRNINILRIKLSVPLQHMALLQYTKI